MLLPLIAMAEIRLYPQYWCQNANPNGRNKWARTYNCVDLTINTEESYILMRINDRIDTFSILSIEEVMVDLWAIKALNERGKRVLFQLSIESNSTELYMITDNGTLGFLET